MGRISANWVGSSIGIYTDTPTSTVLEIIKTTGIIICIYVLYVLYIHTYDVYAPSSSGPVLEVLHHGVGEGYSDKYVDGQCRV